jgi:hypothetical protein
LCAIVGKKRIRGGLSGIADAIDIVWLAHLK